jgi:hypothetical protein
MMNQKMSRRWKGAQLGAPTVLLALLLGGCAKYYYNPSPQILPQYILKIAIRQFANHTQQFGIEDKLTLAVQQLFNQDGRFQITTEDQADGVVIGDITKYILEPLAYDQNNVPTQYKLWILVNVTFYDKVKNQTLWTEPNLGLPITYFSASSSQPGALTETEAQQQIWNQVAMDISTRTLEGFGTVTGSSDKAVPKSSPDQYNPSVGGPQPTPAIAPNSNQGNPPY